MKKILTVLMCGVCGKIFSKNYDGLYCDNKDCRGFLKETEVVLLEDEIKKVEDIRG